MHYGVSTGHTPLTILLLHHATYDVTGLHFKGVETSAQVSVDGGAAQVYTLARDYTIELTLTMAPRSIHTVVITSAEFRE